MLAAVLRTLGETPRIEELTLPRSLEPGQVRVSMRATGICGAQIHEISGDKGPDPYLPHLLGHEGAGVVEDVGVGVTTVQPGDHVVCHWRKGSGMEATPPTYTDASGASVGAGPCATWTEQAILSENRVTSIPSHMPFDKAALLGCGVTTGFGVVIHEAKVQPGESILVAGVGGVGLNVIQAARMVSACPVVAYDRSEACLMLSVQLGADYIYTEDQIEDIGMVDVFVDCTGDPGIIEWGHGRLCPGGRTILVGQPQQVRDVTFRNMSQHYCGKTLMDSQGGLTDPDRDIFRLVTLWEAGRLNLLALLGQRYTLDLLPEALAHHQADSAGRVLLEMSS